MNSPIRIAGIVIILAVAGYFLYANSAPQTKSEVNTNIDESTSAGMRAEENMVVVSEQRPGNIVTGSLMYLAAPGYLVIHEDNNGEPGAIIGSSAQIDAGESTDVKVTLSRSSKDGEILHAMLHFEKGGNSAFSAAEDTPVPSVLGGSIHGWFEVSVDASVDVPVTSLELVQKLLTAPTSCGGLCGMAVRNTQNIPDILRVPHRPLASPHEVSPVSILFSQALEHIPGTSFRGFADSDFGLRTFARLQYRGYSPVSDSFLAAKSESSARKRASGHALAI